MNATFHRLARPVALLLATGVLTACAEGDGEAEATGAGESRPVVHTVNYPLMYFADRLAGESVEVRFLAPADGDPAFWEPSDEDIRAMQSADLILLNGANYAKWLGHVSLPESRLVDTGRDFREALIEAPHAATHSHGDGDSHSHAGVAFTTWIDLRQARQHVEAVRDALVGLVPDDQAAIEANTKALLADIDALDADLETVATAIGDRPLVASHPVYQYFARRYGLAIDSLLWEPETVPDENAMGDLASLRQDHPAEWMIWEGEPAAESIAMLETVGVRSVVFDPCGNRPDDGDWLTVMRRNVENLKGIR